jgi:hypothetical protein
VRDILAVDVTPAMVDELRKRFGAPSTLGNEACVRPWLGDVMELPAYQASGFAGVAATAVGLPGCSSVGCSTGKARFNLMQVTWMLHKLPARHVAVRKLCPTPPPLFIGVAKRRAAAAGPAGAV